MRQIVRGKPLVKTIPRMPSPLVQGQAHLALVNLMKTEERVSKGAEREGGKQTDGLEDVVRSITSSERRSAASGAGVDRLGAELLLGEPSIGTPRTEVKVDVSGKVSSSDKSMASTISAVKRVGAFSPARRDMLI